MAGSGGRDQRGDSKALTPFAQRVHDANYGVRPLWWLLVNTQEMRHGWNDAAACERAVSSWSEECRSKGLDPESVALRFDAWVSAWELFVGTREPWLMANADHPLIEPRFEATADLLRQWGAECDALAAECGVEASELLALRDRVIVARRCSLTRGDAQD